MLISVCVWDCLLDLENSFIDVYVSETKQWQSNTTQNLLINQRGYKTLACKSETGQHNQTHMWFIMC